jgi:hypothetical protein
MPAAKKPAAKEKPAVKEPAVKRPLGSLAFGDGGARLWISAGPKKAPVGLSIVAVP